MKQAESKHGFSVIFARVFIGAIGVIVVALAVLWAALASYQKSLPSSFPEEVLESYRTADGETLLTQCGNFPAGMTAQRLSAFLQGLDRSDMFLARDGETEDGVRYALYSGRRRLGVATVRAGSKKGLFGFARYEKVSYEQTPAFYYTVTVPAGVEVLGDGESLEAFLAQGSALAFFEEAGLHCGAKEYRVPDCWGLQQVTAPGADAQVSKSEDGKTFAVRLLPTQKMQEEVEAFVTTLSKKYMVFATKENVPRSTLLNLTVKDSAFYKMVSSYYNDWGMTYSKDSYENFTLSDCTRYTDTEYSCHVSMEYVVYWGNKQKAYPLSATFYVTKASGKWLAVAMELN